MQTWFIYACLSALFAGVQSTIQKIAIKRGVSTVLVNSYSALVSSICAFSLFIYFEKFNQSSYLGYLLIFIAGGLYMYGTISRSRSLRYLDSSVVFPSYKALALLGTVIGGIFLFKDHLNIYSFIGIALSISVPFLLVEHHETKHLSSNTIKHRFKLYKLGWFLLYISISAGIISSLLTKFTISFFSSMLLFTAANHFFASIVGLVQQTYNHLDHKERILLDERHPHSHLFLLSLFGGLAQCGSFYCLLLALSSGQVSTVYAVNSVYLVLPVLFSIWYYHERINLKRILAIIFSIVAVFLLK